MTKAQYYNHVRVLSFRIKTWCFVSLTNTKAEVSLDLDEAETAGCREPESLLAIGQDGTIDPADEAERKQEERYCQSLSRFQLAIITIAAWTYSS